MSDQDKVLKKIPLGLYLHVPFCASTCDFCAFYQEKPRRKEIERYLKGIETELNTYPKLPIETVFWGGGTPGLLPEKDLQQLGSILLQRSTQIPKEWSIEMAPSTVKRDKLIALKELGVNRISMGVQSFKKDLLDSLSRLHSPQQVYKAYELIREVGFNSVNLDLIFAIPGQDRVQWEEDLNEAIRLAPEHISTYCLTFEEDTKLYLKLAQGKIKQDIEQEAQLYEGTWGILEDAGYFQYEVSNFSKKGHECIHNVNTWKMYNWIGVGPSAASQYNNKRYTNVASINEWLTGIESQMPNRIDCEVLDNITLFVDAILFGLRMNRGINLEDLINRFGITQCDNLKTTFNNLQKESLCIRVNGQISLTDKGRLIVDAISAEFLHDHGSIMATET